MHWFCWHDWTPWQTYVWRGTIYGTAGYLITGDLTPRAITRTMQGRYCRKCGKEVHREVDNADGVKLAR